jgi:hypothetical protein
MRGPALSLKSAILVRMNQVPDHVWTPLDFVDLGARGSVDLALHRLIASNEIRRIGRGLYDKPRMNQLTGKTTYPDYRAVIDALARRDKARMVVDGLTAANDLGLTDAVPARAQILTDARLKPIKLGNLTIDFQRVSPNRLYWAGRPAMRVVQALHWLRDMLPRDKDRIFKRLLAVLHDPSHGKAIEEDLRNGLPALPEWLHEIVRNLLNQAKAQNENQETKGKP